jgi:uncharacterized protein YxeA
LHIYLKKLLTIKLYANIIIKADQDILVLEKRFLTWRQVMKKTAIIALSVLTLLSLSSYAQANHRSRSDNYTVHETHRTVANHNDDCPDETHSHSYSHRGYGNHHQKHFRHHQSSHRGYGHHHQPRHIYVEKHVYTHAAPRVTHYQTTYRTYNPRPTYTAPVRSYSSYNSYNGDVVGDTLIGGAFGAAAGAAIGAALGNPGQGAALGAAIGGFNGISRGVFGRGLLW